MSQTMSQSIIALVVLLQAFHGASGARPSYDAHKVGVQTNLAESPVRHQVPASSNASLVQRSFAATSAATGLPIWAIRAAAWPAFMHPGVVASVKALDMAVSYGNLTGVAVSFIQQPPLEAPADGGLAGLLPVVLFALVFVGMEGFFANFHKTRVADRRPEFPTEIQDEVSMCEEPHDFQYSAIRCCGLSTFLYSCFAPGIRHADTLAAAGIRSYWFTFAAFVAIETASWAAFAMAPEVEGVTVVIDGDAALLRGLVLAVLFVPARRALRTKFDSPQAGSWLKDSLCWVFCSYCVIAQEGLQVDSAGGVEVSCPCRLTDLITGELVGAPVGEADKSAAPAASPAEEDEDDS